MKSEMNLVIRTQWKIRWRVQLQVPLHIMIMRWRSQLDGGDKLEERVEVVTSRGEKSKSDVVVGVKHNNSSKRNRGRWIVEGVEVI